MALERGGKDETMWTWQHRLVLTAFIVICAILPLKNCDIFPLDYLDTGIHYRQHRGQVEFVKRGGLGASSVLTTAELIELFFEAKNTHLLYAYYDSYKQSRYLFESENDMILLSSSLPDGKQSFMRRKLKKVKKLTKFS